MQFILHVRLVSSVPELRQCTVPWCSLECEVGVFLPGVWSELFSLLAFQFMLVAIRLGLGQWQFP